LNAVICNVTDVEDQIEAEANAVKVYPNPAQQSFAVELPEQTFNVVVFDITGKQIFKAENIFQKMKIDANAFNNGIYTVRVTTRDQAVYHQKVMVMH
ncbi:MAG: T9SS type A sorting domain-containing protein, partial [Saprospiraceae bacterium]